MERSFTAEMAAMEGAGKMFPLLLRPQGAWYLFTALQVALKNEEITGDLRKAVQAFAENLETRLCADNPAMLEVARMGWGREIGAAKRPPEEEKRKPKRTPDNKEVTPANKQIDAPENKGRRG